MSRRGGEWQFAGDFRQSAEGRYGPRSKEGLLNGGDFIRFPAATNEPKMIASMTNQLQTLDQAKNTIIDLSIRFGPKALVAIIIMAIGYFVARWVAGMSERSLNKLKLEPPVRLLLLRVVRLVVLGLFLVMALTNLGVDLLPLIAGLGVAGAGVALAMQGVLGNLAAGLTIIFTRPFRVGEYIELGGVHGQVVSIELFATTLLHTDASRVVIPNRKIVGEILHNYGRIRQLDLSVGVAYASNLNDALALVRNVLDANAKVLKEPAPVVGVSLLGDSSINIAVKPWTSVDDYIAAGPEINKAIVEQFRANRIEIPFPQREVRMLS
jgi:small conductance mechanosensitive channel